MITQRNEMQAFYSLKDALKLRLLVNCKSCFYFFTN